MTRPVTLYLVRHGLAEGAAGRCVGQCDLALSIEGRAAIAALGTRWRAPHPDRVVSSDLTRAADSAAALAAAFGTGDVAHDARLREMAFGRWDGRPWSELERDDGPALDAWMADWEHAPAPGGERFADVIARAAAWLAETVGRARAERVERLAVVAHAGSIRALLVHALGVSRATSFRLRIDHARVSALHLTGDVLATGCAAAELLYLNSEVV